VGKPWYNFFVVSDERSDTLPAPVAPADAPAARRVADVVPDAGAEPAFTAPVTSPTALEDIYSSARIAMPAHGYTVLKVAEMLESEHIRALPADVKRKSILVALDAAGVTVSEIVEDAVHRDRALDTYERVLQKNLDDLRSRKQAENTGIEAEIARLVAELRARIDANTHDVAAETESLRTWQARKRDEERRIADAVSYFVSENPITTALASPAAADKGGTTHDR
jgi:Asp-tRNA(Asn)/Glu-tRNA(Gln) amidotransferase A subunit family amidase